MFRGSEEIYVSEMKFVDDTWAYIGIVYKDGNIQVYFNNIVSKFETSLNTRKGNTAN